MESLIQNKFLKKAWSFRGKSLGRRIEFQEAVAHAALYQNRPEHTSYMSWTVEKILLCMIGGEFFSFLSMERIIQI